MKTIIHTRGQPRVPGARETVREYGKRISDWPLSHTTRLPQSKPPSDYWVALSPEGSMIRTEELHRWLGGLVSRSVKRVRFLIGGKEGLSGAVLDRCDWSWSLSPLVFNQSIALVVVTEQLYRCYTLRQGHPYHE